MRTTLLLLTCVTVFAGLVGCERTVGPDEFLYLHRRGDGGVYNGEGFRSEYAGSDWHYHYLEVRRRTRSGDAAGLMLHGGFQDETVQCPTEELPETFPSDFDTLRTQGLAGARPETPDETRQYIREYLDTRAPAGRSRWDAATDGEPIGGSEMDEFSPWK